MLAAQADMIDVGAMREAVDTGAKYGVDGEMVAAAEAKLQQVLSTRGDADTTLRVATAPAAAALDLGVLKMALEQARAAGCPRAAVEAAQQKLDQVTQQRGEAAHRRGP